MPRRRRPVNLTEVSLYLDNSEGDLPIAYQEVVITRRLSRSGQSEYLLNNTPARLRDIQDLLRGTGLGSDAGVVIEAKMIDLLLSDRAEERRSLFEEAAGIGLYRDRKHSTERRLEETATDLQRLEDLIAEVQSQIRSLARQKGKAERHVKLMEEKFAVTLTLARRQLDELAERSLGVENRHRVLSARLPELREELAWATASRDRGGARAAPRRRPPRRNRPAARHGAGGALPPRRRSGRGGRAAGPRPAAPAPGRGRAVAGSPAHRGGGAGARFRPRRAGSGGARACRNTAQLAASAPPRRRRCAAG